jgi:hypothetical protein
MESDVAVGLIENGIPKDKIQTWADLGAGSGFFTQALSKLLPTGSSIVVVDKKIIPIKVANGIGTRTIAGDFLEVDFGKPEGILMANALHYVKDQQRFLAKLATKTKRLILVEYNIESSNQWIPYPITFDKLRSLWPNAKLMSHAPSSYHKQGIYSALLLF